MGPGALVSKGEVLFCPHSCFLSAFPPTDRNGMWCKEMWHVPVLPTQVGRAVSWEAELPLAVGTPAGVSESCSSPSTILGICVVGRCLAPSPGAAPGLKAILYLKQPEAYVSLIFFAKANPSFLYGGSKWQIRAGRSAHGVRRSRGFLCLS